MTKQTYKVLVVEDEEYLRDLYAQILSEKNIDVETAKDGLEALELIKHSSFHLILLDIILPNLDGLQMLERLKSEKNFEQITKKVVLLTNLGQDLVISKALEYKVRGFMVKSDYTPESIQKEVLDYLEDRVTESSL